MIGNSATSTRIAGLFWDVKYDLISPEFHPTTAQLEMAKLKAVPDGEGEWVDFSLESPAAPSSAMLPSSQIPSTSSEAVCSAAHHVRVENANVVYNIIVPDGEVDKVNSLLEIRKQNDCGHIDKRRVMSPRKVQKYRSPVHSSDKCRTQLNDSFTPRTVGRLVPVNWTVRPSDLTPVAYFSCGYIKAEVWLFLLFLLVLVSIFLGFLEMTSPQTCARSPTDLKSWIEGFLVCVLLLLLFVALIGIGLGFTDATSRGRRGGRAAFIRPWNKHIWILNFFIVSIVRYLLPQSIKSVCDD